MILGAVDIGNATTEVLLGSAGSRAVEPLWSARAPTRGRKGGDASLAMAAELVAAGERAVGERCGALAMTRLRPVDTVDLAVPMPRAPAGPVRDLCRVVAGTPAGHGLAVGTHLPLSALGGERRTEAVIVSVDRTIDFEVAATAVRRALSDGWSVAGLLLEGDDAVLVHNRIDSEMPIVDEVDLEGVASGDRVVIEVAARDGPLAVLTDPIALAWSLALPDSAAQLADLARAHVDRVAGAVAGRGDHGTVAEPEAWAPWMETQDGCRMAVSPALVELVRRRPVGTVGTVCLDPASGPRPVADAFLVDLDAAGRAGWLRRGVVDETNVPLATLATVGPEDAAAAFGALTGRPVALVAEEARAARAGALSTPGAPAGAAILDLGGGTVDLATPDGDTVAAGAGDLLTTAVAVALGVPRGVAEEIKRGPAARLIGPQLLHLEDGGRRYLDAPLSGGMVGRLVRRASDGFLSFAADLAPEEWRGLRLALKEETVGANAERLMLGLGELPRSVLTVGGAAADGELVRILGERLRPQGTVVGRADVAGRYGTRHAVTFGLLTMLAATRP